MRLEVPSGGLDKPVSAPYKKMWESVLEKQLRAMSPEASYFYPRPNGIPFERMATCHPDQWVAYLIADRPCFVLGTTEMPLVFDISGWFGMPRLPTENATATLALVRHEDVGHHLVVQNGHTYIDGLFRGWTEANTTIAARPIVSGDVGGLQATNDKPRLAAYGDEWHWVEVSGGAAKWKSPMVHMAISGPVVKLFGRRLELETTVTGEWSEWCTLESVSKTSLSVRRSSGGRSIDLQIKEWSHDWNFDHDLITKAYQKWKTGDNVLLNLKTPGTVHGYDYLGPMIVPGEGGECNARGCRRFVDHTTVGTVAFVAAKNRRVEEMIALDDATRSSDSTYLTSASQYHKLMWDEKKPTDAERIYFGKQHEDDALLTLHKYLESAYGWTVRKNVAYHVKDLVRATPDGIVSVNGSQQRYIAEAKSSPKGARLRLPLRYWLQVQATMYVWNMDGAWVVSWSTQNATVFFVPRIDVASLQQFFQTMFKDSAQFTKKKKELLERAKGACLQCGPIMVRHYSTKTTPASTGVLLPGAIQKFVNAKVDDICRQSVNFWRDFCVALDALGGDEVLIDLHPTLKKHTNALAHVSMVLASYEIARREGRVTRLIRCDETRVATSISNWMSQPTRLYAAISRF